MRNKHTEKWWVCRVKCRWGWSHFPEERNYEAVSPGLINIIISVTSVGRRRVTVVQVPREMPWHWNFCSQLPLALKEGIPALETLDWASLLRPFPAKQKQKKSNWAYPHAPEKTCCHMDAALSSLCRPRINNAGCLGQLPGQPSLAVLIPLAGTFYDNAPRQNSNITMDGSSFTTPPIFWKVSGY